MVTCLSQSFFARPARVVAKALLGTQLVRIINGQRVSGFIVETEAYCDSIEPDLACHATKNKGQPTPRSGVMFGNAGIAYVYFTYGMHWMFNIVTGQEGQANAVLIRALEPHEGTMIMKTNRNGRPRTEWTNGPAKLTQALNIDKDLNGFSLYDSQGEVWLEQGKAIFDQDIAVGSRVGLGKTPEPWFSIPWRYWIIDNPFVSVYRS